MTKEQIKELFNSTAEEAGVKTYLTLDEDEIKDLMIDRDNRIYLCSQLTPYKADDVDLIKYRIYEDEEDTFSEKSVMIIFKNGDSIKLDDIGFSAMVNFHLYEDQEALKYFSNLTSEENKHELFHTWHDVKNKLEVCFEKASVFDFDLQQNEQSYADIFFDNDTLYIANSIKTPYRIADIKRIQYLVCSEEEIECGMSNCVCIAFFNGDCLKFLDFGEYDAYIKIGKEFHYFHGIEKIAHRYALEIKAKELRLNENEFVIIDNILAGYYGENQDVVIPEGVEVIDEQVFQHNDIKSVVFPSTLKRICERSFGNCSQLECVVMNNGLEIIEKEAFHYCNKLRNITLPISLRLIGSQAFFCTSISKEDVVFPPNCKLGTYLFDGKNR